LMTVFLSARGATRRRAETNWELMSPLMAASPPRILPLPFTVMGGRPSLLLIFTPSCWRPSTRGSIGRLDRDCPPVSLHTPSTRLQTAVMNRMVVPDSPQSSSA